MLSKPSLCIPSNSSYIALITLVGVCQDSLWIASPVIFEVRIAFLIDLRKLHCGL